jgi:ligand-binding sensor domain-containing protein
MKFNKLGRIISLIALIQLFVFTFKDTNLLAQKFEPENISIPNGLSNAEVNCIYQDKYGLLWVGTKDGLNKYDGYSFKVFKNIPGNPNSIINSDIWDITEDDNGDLWIATLGGVSHYIRKANKFINYDFEEELPNYNPVNPQTLRILFDSHKNLWVSTLGLGLRKFNKESNQFEDQKYLYKDSIYTTLENIVAFPLWEDSNKKIWAGLNNFGLMFYDQEKQLFVEAEIKNKSQASDFTREFNNLTKIFSDQSGKLWLVSQSGIFKYNPITKDLKQIKYFKDRSSFILFEYETGLTQDNEGNIWIGKDQRGLYKFDGISDDYTQINFGELYANRPGVYNRMIKTIYTDNTGILWFGTFITGLYKYDPAREPFKVYVSDTKNSKSISGNEVFRVIESKFRKGKLFVGTRGSGLNLFDKDKKEFERIPLKLTNSTDMFGGSVRSILEDDDGTLWLGTWGDGIIKLDKNFNITNQFKTDSTNRNSLNDALIRNLYKDINGKIWVGTNGLLHILDPITMTIKRVYEPITKTYPQRLFDIISQKINSKNSISKLTEVGNSQDLTSEFSITKPREFLIVSAGEGMPTDSLMADFGWIEDKNGNLIWSSELAKDNYHLGNAIKNRLKTNLVKLSPGSYKLRYKSDDSHSFGNWNADAPSDSSFWGIRIFELENNEVSEIAKLLKETEEQLVISGRNIRSIHMSGEIVWIGTDAEGLNKYNLRTGSIKYYKHEPGNPNSLSDNSVQFIHEDSKGNLWLATNGGLNKFNPKTEKFEIYTEVDGLPTNFIASILEEEDGNLWLSTRNGLSHMRFNHEDQTIDFVNYDTQDGLGGTDFIALVALKTTDGTFYFGGDHGLDEFTPGKINSSEPTLVFSDIKISNKSISAMGEDSPIESSIYDLKEFTLPYSQNDISFEFAALHYSRPDKNRYEYILEGYDKDWIRDNRRFASYTNLDPGEYRFKFKGSNRDGVWNKEGKVLQFRISPPWWMTVWAYIGYGFLFVGIVFGIDRIQRRRLLAKVKERRRIEEAELRAETAELQARASEAERKVLEAEFSQKKKELDEARELQLSMLPKELPQLPNLDIAVYMKTATEVGGDYYDFHIGLDGTLTVVLGDATGHGMKAGTMVTTTKSLFNVLAPNPNIVETFHEMTQLPQS